MDDEGTDSASDCHGVILYEPIMSDVSIDICTDHTMANSQLSASG